MMVTANDDMFWPLTGHHQVVHPMKRGWGAFHWMYNQMMALSLDLQPDDGLFIGGTT